MTRSELNTIAAMTDPQIAPLTCVNLSDMNAMVVASNKKDTDYQAQIATLIADKAKALADAKTASDADKAAVLTAAATAAATDKAAAIAAATDPLHAQITTLTTSLATANATITQLQQQVATLQSTISGSAKAYVIVPDAVQQASLEIEAANRGITVQRLIEIDCGFDASALASTHKNDILAKALANYPTLSADTQAMILTALNMSAFIGTPMAAQLQALQAMAIPQFNSLPPEIMNAIITAVKV